MWWQRRRGRLERTDAHHASDQGSSRLSPEWCRGFVEGHATASGLSVHGLSFEGKGGKRDSGNHTPSTMPVGKTMPKATIWSIICTHNIESCRAPSDQQWHSGEEDGVLLDQARPSRLLVWHPNDVHAPQHARSSPTGLREPKHEA